ncbi:MAG: hypothetical protein V8R61_08265 [Enterocloster sp.]
MARNAGEAKEMLEAARKCQSYPRD